MMAYSHALPFVVCAEYEDRKGVSKKIESSFFVTLLEKIMTFFDSGVAPFSFDETLEAMRFRDLVIKAEKTPGEWVCEE